MLNSAFQNSFKTSSKHLLVKLIKFNYWNLYQNVEQTSYNKRHQHKTFHHNCLLNTKKILHQCHLIQFLLENRGKKFKSLRFSSFIHQSEDLFTKAVNHFLVIFFFSYQLAEINLSCFIRFLFNRLLKGREF